MVDKLRKSKNGIIRSAKGKRFRAKQELTTIMRPSIEAFFLTN